MIRSVAVLFSVSVGTVFLGVIPDKAFVRLECDPELLVVFGTPDFG